VLLQVGTYKSTLPQTGSRIELPRLSTHQTCTARRARQMWRGFGPRARTGQIPCFLPPYPPRPTNLHPGARRNLPCIPCSTRTRIAMQHH
jgi:hypothetical protein